MNVTAFYSGEYNEDATGVIIERMIVNYLKGEFKNAHLKRAVEIINDYHTTSKQKVFHHLQLCFIS